MVGSWHCTLIQLLQSWSIPREQDDTLAPFLFVLAVDWMMRRALTQELIAECGICETPCRSSHNPAYYLSDLDFADDIALLSHNMSTA